MQSQPRQLIQESGICSELALAIHNEAAQRARLIAINHKIKDFASDEIVVELEAILLPILMEKNLADKNVLNKLIKVIEDWYPDNLDSEDINKCAAVQHVLLSSLKNYPQIIEDKFEMYYFIFMHEGWKGLACSKSGKVDKIPKTIDIARQQCKDLPMEFITFTQKINIVASLEKSAAIKTTNQQSVNTGLFSTKRDETTLHFYKLAKDWFRLTIENRAMLMETIIDNLDVNKEKNFKRYRI